MEVILVLLIIAVLTTVALTRNAGTASKAKLHGEADLLKTQLRYAQARALNADLVWGLATDDANKLWLFSDGDVTNRERLPGENADLIDYATDARKTGLSVGGGGTLPSAFLVSFDDRGRPHAADDASDDPATAAIRLSVTDGTDTIHIDITADTGFIP